MTSLAAPLPSPIPPLAVWVSRLLFNDGTALDLAPSDVVMIVGPNNAGKSLSLKGIAENVAHPGKDRRIFSRIEVAKGGTENQLKERIEASAVLQPDSPPTDLRYQGPTGHIFWSQAREGFARPQNGLGPIAQLFVLSLDAQNRLKFSAVAGSIPVGKAPPQHPAHHLYEDPELEARLSNAFRQAFGVDLVVDRNGGSQVPLHVGNRPTVGRGESAQSRTYIERLRALAPLAEQGDGIKAFAGLYLEAAVGHHSVVTIDEPEAFLHPPQARLLAKMLVRDSSTSRQLFIATHSADILRGALDANSARVRILRLRRNGDLNCVTQLDHADVKRLWSDPLLRYSNALDGLFHEAVVLCEGDGDCRFYNAVLDAMVDADGETAVRPDVLFTHCGGKDRMPVVADALRAIGVPVFIVGDFDVLDGEHLLQRLVESAGMMWADVSQEWSVVMRSIESTARPRTTRDVLTEIGIATRSLDQNAPFPEVARDAVRTATKSANPWRLSKEIGKSIVPAGEATSTCDHLLSKLRNAGLHVVPVGHLESFARSVRRHGPAWVLQVLQRPLATDPELAEARTFVGELLSAIRRLPTGLAS